MQVLLSCDEIFTKVKIFCFFSKIPLTCKLMMSGFSCYPTLRWWAYAKCRPGLCHFRLPGCTIANFYFASSGLFYV